MATILSMMTMTDGNYLQSLGKVWFCRIFELIGQFLKINLPKLLGGDVNGDDVIDVLDALYIQTYWGTNKRNADINIDGKVDAKDLAFVEKHYLMQNPSVQNAQKPKSKYKTKTLEIVKSELGL